MPYLSVVEGRLESGNGKGRKLTLKMVSFIDHYMITMNAAEAVRLSGYKVSDVGRHAAELLQHPLIIAEIKQRMTKRSEKAEVKAEYLINKLIQIIDSDEIKTADQLRAIELAGKSIALWKERQEISGPDGEAIRHEQTIRENATDFASRISSLAKRAGTDGTNVVPLRSGDGSS